MSSVAQKLLILPFAARGPKGRTVELELVLQDTSVNTDTRSSLFAFSPHPRPLCAHRAHRTHRLPWRLLGVSAGRRPRCGRPYCSCRPTTPWRHLPPARPRRSGPCLAAVAAVLMAPPPNEPTNGDVAAQPAQARAQAHDIRRDSTNRVARRHRPRKGPEWYVSLPPPPIRPSAHLPIRPSTPSA